MPPKGKQPQKGGKAAADADDDWEALLEAEAAANGAKAAATKAAEDALAAAALKAKMEEEEEDDEDDEEGGEGGAGGAKGKDKKKKKKKGKAAGAKEEAPASAGPMTAAGKAILLRQQQVRGVQSRVHAHCALAMCLRLLPQNVDFRCSARAMSRGADRRRGGSDQGPAGGGGETHQRGGAVAPPLHHDAPPPVNHLCMFPSPCRMRRKRRSNGLWRRKRSASARPSRSVLPSTLTPISSAYPAALLVPSHPPLPPPACHVPRASQDKVEAQKAAGTYMTKAEKEKARIKQVRGWPAWIRVWRVEGPSFPGTPNLSLILLGAWLAHLDMARVEMARLDMARLDIALLSLVLPRI